MSDLGQLLEKYREYARIHYAVDFKDKASVKRGNRAATQMLEIAQTIENEFTNGAEAFTDLLAEPEYKIDCWAAFHLMDRMGINPQQQQKALAVLERYAQSEDIDAAGVKLWLQEWKKKK